MATYRRVSASADDGNPLLLLRFLRRARSSWQLQHSRLLTHAEPGEQHNLPVGELKRVVMHVRLLLLDLPEPSHFPPELFPRHPVREENALDLVLERNLRAGKKAHGHVWFSHRGTTTSDRVVECRRHQFVCDLCRSGCNELQTVVAHGRGSPNPCSAPQPVPFLRRFTAKS